MNILCATDDNYVQPCYIMLLSLFDNNASNEVDVYILVSKLTKASKQALKSISKNPQHRVNLIEVDDRLEHCPIREGDHVSIAAYYRILAPLLLPKEIDKVLYLDVDMIVCQDLTELYSTDIDNYAIGAVLDDIYYNAQDRYDRLEYSPSLGYINSGMLLMNLNYWREHRIMEECLEFIRDFPEKNIFHDQDTINHVLSERRKLLPLKYNFQILFLNRTCSFEPQVKEEIYNIVDKKNYVIIHYTGGKPWVSGYYCPYKEQYLKYKRLSPYAKTPVIRRHSRVFLFKRWLYDTLAKWGIVKPLRTYIVMNGELDIDK